MNHRPSLARNHHQLPCNTFADYYHLQYIKQITVRTSLGSGTSSLVSGGALIAITVLFLKCLTSRISLYVTYACVIKVKDQSTIAFNFLHTQEKSEHLLLRADAHLLKEKSSPACQMSSLFILRPSAWGDFYWQLTYMYTCSIPKRSSVKFQIVFSLDWK